MRGLISYMRGRMRRTHIEQSPDRIRYWARYSGDPATRTTEAGDLVLDLRDMLDPMRAPAELAKWARARGISLDGVDVLAVAIWLLRSSIGEALSEVPRRSHLWRQVGCLYDGGDTDLDFRVAIRGDFLEARMLEARNASGAEPTAP